MPLFIKPSAKLKGLQPEILIGLRVLEDVLDKYGYDTVITEATGGSHMEESLHYKGLALDIRSKHIVLKDTKTKIMLEVKLALQDDYDFLLENPNSPNEHFHLEFDPK